MAHCYLCDVLIEDFNSSTYRTFDGRFTVSISVMRALATVNDQVLEWEQLTVCRTCAKLQTMRDYDE